ncbi:glutathione S-transferase T3 [Zea mays]|uniref:glutathione S-transferase T3 n=1 Tax=Zea mays TaxID=4577 RepID=UPI0004DEA4BD|nr:glutathione S-transferase T3-like [Zea mays]
MQPPRSSAMNAQPQVRRDSQLIREVLSFGGGIPHWQMATVRELDLDGGSELHPTGGSLFSDDLCATMDGNGYFSSMMRDDNSQREFDTHSNTCPELQSQSMSVCPVAPNAGPNNKRSKNFSDDEDEVLVSAWLNISLDPIVGKDQKGGRYWSRIFEYFHEHNKCQSKRTLNSLMHRWETIQKCVNKFCGCLTRIELRRQSGTTMQDMVAQACALYKSEDEHKKSFQFMHRWNKLRTQPKWLAKLDDLASGRTSNKKQKTQPNVDGTAMVPNEKGDNEVQAGEDQALIRPTRKKKSKAAIIQEKRKSVTTTLENMCAQKKDTDGEKEVKKEERFNKAFALEQERVTNEKLLLEVRKEEVELRKQQIELQKQRDEERIMTLDLSAMPEELRRYYMGLRAKIMRNEDTPST